METWYNNDTYDSIQQPDFFNEKEMNWVKDIYWNMFDDFCKTYMSHHISEKKYIRIEEANFTKSPWPISFYGTDPANVITWGQIVGKVYDVDANGKLLQQCDKITIDFQPNNENWAWLIDQYQKPFLEIADLMEHKFAELERPAYVKDLAFHNMAHGLKVHNDGQDIKTKLKNAVPRPDHHPNYAPEEYTEKESVMYAHQGLVNLDAQKDNATIIFDQWFPYSTYYDIANDINNLGEPKRPVISFAKGDQFERFGEHIRGLTNKHFDKQDYIHMSYPLKNYKDVQKFRKLFPIDKLFGLTLNKILYFGNPGTLISWDHKRYHMAKPFAVIDQINNEHGFVGYTGIGTTNRLMLQYETQLRND